MSEKKPKTKKKPLKKTTFVYLIEKKRVEIHRIKVKISLIDPLNWLEEKSIFPKIVWREKFSASTTICLGALIKLSSLPSLTAVEGPKNGPRFFTTTNFLHTLFSKSKHSVWSEFSDCCCFLPKIQIQINKEGVGFLYFHFQESEQLEELKELLEKFDNFINLNDEDKCSLLQRIDIPNFGCWCDNIERTQAAFETTDLEKVVLARASYFSFEKPKSPLFLTKELLNTSKNSTVFAYLTNKDTGFIGASPEIFYKRKKEKFFTEAVAGSSGKGGTEEENKEVIQSLKSCEKANREFNFVSRFLLEKLKKLCFKYSCKSHKTITETSTLFHLYRKFKGDLKPGVDDKRLIQELHPTPAIGGYPQNLACDFVDQTEPFVRGLYSSPMGWISPNSTSLIVAIRSAFIKKQNLTLFSGAGIVKGSVASKEWEELELKISHILKIACKTP